MRNRTYEEFCICFDKAKTKYLEFIMFEEWETMEKLDRDRYWKMYNDRHMATGHLMGLVPNPWPSGAFSHYLYNAIESHVKLSLIKQAMNL